MGLAQENPLEKETVTRPGIFAWRIPRTEEPGRLVHELQRVERVSDCHSRICINSMPSTQKLPIKCLRTDLNGVCLICHLHIKDGKCYNAFRIDTTILKTV